MLRNYGGRVKFYSQNTPGLFTAGKTKAARFGRLARLKTRGQAAGVASGCFFFRAALVAVFFRFK